MVFILTAQAHLHSIARSFHSFGIFAYFLLRNLIGLPFFPAFLELTMQLASQFFGDLLDSIIVDVASECHRIARLGLDQNLEDEEEELKLSTQARVRAADPGNSGKANSKYVVDIFGQTHPSVANEVFDCMNCGRSAVSAGRFAPHLEKCMGKVILYLCFACFWYGLLISG